MVISNAFSFFLLSLVISLEGSKATLKTSFIENLCAMESTTTLDLTHERSGILMSGPRPKDIFQCELILRPPEKTSIALSIYRYAIYKGDRLTIQDSDNHKISLVGKAIFGDEKKSIISDGKMTIKYTYNNTLSRNLLTKDAGFQFTFTVLHNSPCMGNEFQCRNGKCLHHMLLCDGHNHCGDKSDQINCEPVTPKIANPVFVPKPTKNYGLMIAGIAVATSMILIIMLVFIVSIIRGRVQKSKTKEQINQNGAASLQSISASVESQPSNDIQRPTETFYNRLRRSFRGTRRTEVEVPVHQETIQVPSMYPNLDQSPSAPDLNAAENPAFKLEE